MRCADKRWETGFDIWDTSESTFYGDNERKGKQVLETGSFVLWESAVPWNLVPLAQLGQSTLKEMPNIPATVLCLWRYGRITVENICSGVPAMLIAGPVVCRESAGARAKSNMFLFSSTVSRFQGEHWSVKGVISLLSHESVHINWFQTGMNFLFCLMWTIPRDVSATLWHEETVKGSLVFIDGHCCSLVCTLIDYLWRLLKAL